MITVRISFEKKNEASYISLLDLQRVMQRVLKRSGLPVWHTLGFNPHIYMTFACPLSLGQESECECVDVKTEAENPDFAQWQTELNAIMPTGIRITHVCPVQMKADLIAFADEHFDENKDLMIFDPVHTWKKTLLKGGTYTVREIMVPVFLKGECVYETPAVMDIQAYCKKELNTLWDESRRFENPQEIHVDLSDKLYDVKKELLNSYHRS